eukprot:g344.t1
MIAKKRGRVSIALYGLIALFAGGILVQFMFVSRMEEHRESGLHSSYELNELKRSIEDIGDRIHSNDDAAKNALERVSRDIVRLLDSSDKMRRSLDVFVSSSEKPEKEESMVRSKELAVAQSHLWARRATHWLKMAKGGQPLRLSPARLLCAEKKVVPSVFFIGGEKAGTTSMYNQIRRSIPHLDTGEKLAAGEHSWNMKEKFYWCEKGSRGLGYPLHKTEYLDHYDECPNFRMANKEKDERGGAWDVFIPAVPATPKPFRVGADHTASMLEDPNVPGRLVEAFGQMSKMLTFIVLLKSEPSEVVRSWLYMSQRNGWVGSSGGKYSSEQLRNQLERYENQVDECKTEQGLDIGSCVVKTHKGECFRQAAYGPLLRVWLEHFEPRQFILIESEYFFEHAEQTMAEIAMRLDLPLNYDAENILKSAEKSRLTNVNKRKPSKTDDAEALTVIRKRIEPMKRDLESVLREHVINGEMSFIGDVGHFLSGGSSR